MKLHHNHCTNCKCVKCVKQFFRGTMLEVVMATLLTPSHWFLASIFKILLKHFYSFPPSPFSPLHTIWMISLKVKSMQKNQCAATSDRRLKIHLAYTCCGVHAITSTTDQLAIKAPSFFCSCRSYCMLLSC